MSPPPPDVADYIERRGNEGASRLFRGRAAALTIRYASARPKKRGDVRCNCRAANTPRYPSNGRSIARNFLHSWTKCERLKLSDRTTCFINEVPTLLFRCRKMKSIGCGAPRSRARKTGSPLQRCNRFIGTCHPRERCTARQRQAATHCVTSMPSVCATSVSRRDGRQLRG